MLLSYSKTEIQNLAEKLLQVAPYQTWFSSKNNAKCPFPQHLIQCFKFAFYFQL